MTYRKKLLAGEVGPDQLDDYIDQWNNTDTSEHLHTYLGFTWPQWQEFMTCPPPYFCPTSGDVEDRQNSGIDQCCDRPELHVPQDL